MVAFPIIDISKITEKYLNNEGHLKDITSDPDLQNVSKQIIDAFSEYGFIYVKGHNIPDGLIQTAFQTAEEFFKLDLSVKNRVYRNENESNWGFVPPNSETFEKTRPFDLKEAFDYNLPNQSKKAEMDGIAPEFMPTSSKMFKYCKSLTMILLKAISMGLNTEDKENFLSNHHTGIGEFSLNPTTLRLLYYPSIDKKEIITEDQLRCGEHSDYGTITLLFQDDAGGLQVVSPSGEYVDATPIPGCIVVNAADMLQLWSGKKIKSTRHRVVVPENRQKPRQSIVYFVHPNRDSIVTDLEDPDSNVSVNPFEYLMMKYKQTYG